MPKGGATSKFILGLKGRSFGDGDAMNGAMGTGVKVPDTRTASETLHESDESAALTLAGTPAGGEMVLFVATRDTADTLAVDTRLISIRVEYGITGSLSDT